MRRKTERSWQTSVGAQRIAQATSISPLCWFRGAGGDPVIVASADGPRVTDAGGNLYIGPCGSRGPLILAHAAPCVALRAT